MLALLTLMLKSDVCNLRMAPLSFTDASLSKISLFTGEMNVETVVYADRISKLEFSEMRILLKP